MNTKYGVGSFGVGSFIVSGEEEWEGGRLQVLCSLTVINKTKQYMHYVKPWLADDYTTTVHRVLTVWSHYVFKPVHTHIHTILDEDSNKDWLPVHCSLLLTYRMQNIDPKLFDTLPEVLNFAKTFSLTVLVILIWMIFFKNWFVNWWHLV